MYEPILDALRRGAHADALSAARDAVASAPQDATAQRLLAMSLSRTGDRAGALAAIDAALALAPDDAGLHLERAGLLLDARQTDEAEAALTRAVGLDPNRFPAYILQGQLALARGQLDDAERLARTASRIAPGHPQIAAIEGMVALRRGDADRALALLAPASQQAPAEGTLLNALGFAYLAKGHFAFAEQAFRRLLEQQPDSVPLRALVADIVRRQGRAADAADEARGLLAREDAAPGLYRTVGELELEANRAADALPPLKRAFAAMPHDRRTLEGLVAAWVRANDAADARLTLDAALAERPEDDNLWRARLVFEPFGGPEAMAVVERWLEARPDHIPALQARAAIHDHAGESDEADAIAYQIVALEPGHTQAELRIIERLAQNDPHAAVARVQGLLERAEHPAAQSGLRQLLGRCFDRAGDPAAAVATWSALHADAVAQHLPLPPQSSPSQSSPPRSATGELPPLAPLPDPAPAVLLLWGAPGSMVERIALVFAGSPAPLRADRYGPRPPADALQRYDTVAALQEGRLDGAALVAQWRAALPARGVADGQVFDWLLWWDNALLQALRPHLPEAVLMAAVRDPRDMLLDWLAFGAQQRFALESPMAAARWLAGTLGQLADLHEQDLYPHRLLRLDELANDPVALATAMADALETRLPAPPSLGPKHLPAGRWRAYAGPLAEAFALLTPVAVRLGYPEA